MLVRGGFLADACLMAAITTPRSVGEIETFITMLRTACSDKSVYDRLERLLSLPDVKRQAVVHAWVSDLLIKGAPRDFIQAIACLSDDQVAERAYQAIYQCRTEVVARRSAGPFKAWLLRAMSAAAALLVVARRSAGRFKTWLLWAISAAAVLLVFVSAFLLWPEPRFREVEPGAPLQARSPAIQAYEDRWWSDVRVTLARFCGGLAAESSGDYPFVVFVNAQGNLLRIETRWAEDTLASMLKQELASIQLAPFTPEQAAEKRQLGLRGRLSIEGGRCTLQKGGWRGL